MIENIECGDSNYLNVRERIPLTIIFSPAKCLNSTEYNLSILLHVRHKLLLETSDSLSQTSNSASSPSLRWRLAGYGNMTNAAECEMIWSPQAVPNGLLDSYFFAVDLGFISHYLTINSVSSLLRNNPLGR